VSDIRYDVDALEANIDRCQSNIKTFEDAIAKERSTIDELRFLVRLERERDKLRGSDGAVNVRSTD